jgi:hypothetical protein
MKNNLLVTIIIASAVSLIVGPTSALLFNSYVNLSGNSLSFGKELNLNSYGYMSPSFIIQEPRKVVVNQDLKVEETITSIRSSLLGVHLKQEISEASYNLSKPFAQALSATTDGWVMVAWPQSIKTTELENMVSDYVLIDSNKKIYEIEQVEISPEVGGVFVFFKLKNSTGLNIKRLVDDTEIKLGQSILLSSPDGSFSLDYLSAKTAEGSVFNSDIYPYNFVLNSGITQGPLLAFNLSGEVIGALDLNGKWLVSAEMNAYWRSLFKLKKVTKASLGFNYVNLSDFININWLDKGALIESFDANILLNENPSILAGLKIGDIITKINGTEINAENNLSVLINLYNPDDTIFIHYLRDGLESEIQLILAAVE